MRSMRDQNEKKKKDLSGHTRMYGFAKKLSSFVVRFLFPVKYIHVERLRDLKAPAILIANHQSWLDPMVIAHPCPHELRFLGKQELHKGRLLSYVMDHLHMIPVARHETDIAAMRACSRVLKDGYVLCIFPEGTRHQKQMMEEVEAGASLLALRSGVPLIPIYFDKKMRFLRPTTVLIGEPIDYADLRADGVNMNNSDLLDQRIHDRFYAMRALVRNQTGDNKEAQK